MGEQQGEYTSRSYEGATWHYTFASCPECGHATVGLDVPYAINHKLGCSMPGDEINRLIREADEKREVVDLLREYRRITARLEILGVDPSRDAS